MSEFKIPEAPTDEELEERVYVIRKGHAPSTMPVYRELIAVRNEMLPHREAAVRLLKAGNKVNDRLKDLEHRIGGPCLLEWYEAFADVEKIYGEKK